MVYIKQPVSNLRRCGQTHVLGVNNYTSVLEHQRPAITCFSALSMYMVTFPLLVFIVFFCLSVLWDCEVRSNARFKKVIVVVVLLIDLYHAMTICVWSLLHTYYDNIISCQGT